MPIIANNIVVGGVQSPTTEKKENVSNNNRPKHSSFQDVVAEAHRKNYKGTSKKVSSEHVVPQKQKKLELSEEKPSHYITKNDGELIRHINKKSGYICDIHEIE